VDDLVAFTSWRGWNTFRIARAKLCGVNEGHRLGVPQRCAQLNFLRKHCGLLMKRSFAVDCSRHESGVLQRNLGKILQMHGRWIRVRESSECWSDLPESVVHCQATIEILDCCPEGFRGVDDECRQIVEALFGRVVEPL